ncbi:SRPBCC family protein [Patulibacter sp. SYSU D01012]|uniref:SRPBCC family protein n=1 Tax=Patulibacter sp. SYSU D01012 TaxID=2817381 RepID=UPI001B30BFDC|nr:SRPBCC family protein [Patulibacter sp. SYSU D01012]
MMNAAPAAPALEIAASIDTTADPARVWALWSDVAAWTSWDHALDAVTLDGPFAPGTPGTLAVHGRPPLAFTLTAVDTGRGYSDETPFPGGTVRLEHRLEPLGDGRVRVTHRARVEGSGPVAASIVDQIRQSLGSAVATLVRVAETA